MNKAQAMWAKRMSSAYIGVKEVSGQVPGTTRNGGRTKSEINNFQASGYVRAPKEWRNASVYRGTEPKPRDTQPKPQGTEARRQGILIPGYNDRYHLSHSH